MSLVRGDHMTRKFRFAVNVPGIPEAGGWLDFAREAEALGYSTLQCADHYGMHEPLTVLAAAATVTSTIRFGPYVLCNDFRHPTVLARQAATVDVLSGGRLELGIGAGWYIDEYERAGLPFDRAPVRMARLEEAITILRGLFGDEPVTFAGDHYDVRGLDGFPKPVQRPSIPIVVGGSGPRMLALAARTADIVAFAVNTTAEGLIDSSDMRVDCLALEGRRRARGSRRPLRRPRAQHDDHRTGDRHRRPRAGRRGRDALPEARRLPDRCPRRLHREGHPAVPLPPDRDARRDRRPARREREEYGISYVTVISPSMRDFAPVVQKLTGT